MCDFSEFAPAAGGGQVSASYSRDSYKLPDRYGFLMLELFYFLNLSCGGKALRCAARGAASPAICPRPSIFCLEARSLPRSSFFTARRAPYRGARSLPRGALLTAELVLYRAARSLPRSSFFTARRGRAKDRRRRAAPPARADILQKYLRRCGRCAGRDGACSIPPCAPPPVNPPPSLPPRAARGR